jgi:TFIIF, beta subunit HTH domain/TFIIF, beta subunit N-terminus
MSSTTAVWSASASSSSSSSSQFPPELLLDGKDTSLWLVKVPAYVADAWSHAQNDDVIGHLSISKIVPPAQAGNSTAKSGKAAADAVTKRVNVRLTEAGSNWSNKRGRIDASGKSSSSSSSSSIEDERPIDYTLAEVAGGIGNTVLALSYDGDIGQYSLAGKCTKNYTLRGKDIESSGAFVHKRNIRQARPAAQIVDMNDPANKAPTSVGGAIDLKAPKVYHGELDERVLKTRVFELFGTEDWISFRDISAACHDIPGVSEDSIRDLLKKFARFHQKGEHKQTWELLEKFKDHSKK